MIVCFDLETTGLDKYNDKIIEVAIVKFDEKTFKIIDTFNSLVDPERPIPKLISNITNIFDDDIKGAPKIENLKDEIIDFIGDATVLGHNVAFDVDFFKNNGISLNNNIAIDTFFMANIVGYKEPSLNLEMLCKSYGVGFKGAHRALNDVLATIKLFEKLKNSFLKLSLDKKRLLNYIFYKSSNKSIIFLKDYIFDDIDDNLDFGDFEKKLLKKIGKHKDSKLSISKKISKFKNISTIFNGLGKVDIRENQLKMSNRVHETFKLGKLSAIEAPTGLGKSFAYLIPSILHSLKSGEKVFISTKTKTLQDQLYFKDLSFLNDNIGYNFSYSKLKGKRNYLSIKAYFDELIDEDIAYAKVGILSKLLLWLLETTYGELDELNFFGQEFSFIRFMNGDNFSTLSDKNDYKEYEFLFKARKKLEESDIVVINHSLLFSDLNTEVSILGNIKNLVIDEAHNIEGSITDSLKKKYTLSGLRDIFTVIEKICDSKDIKKIDIINLKESLLGKLELLDDYGFSYINNKVNSSQNFKLTLIKQDFFENIEYKNILSKIELDFLDIIDKLSTISEYNFVTETSFLQSNLIIIKDILDINSDVKFIKILSYNDNSGISFEYTLLNPGEYLLKNLWNKLNSCLLTSATLEISGSFEYFTKMLSLENFSFYSFESDFNYKKQATLFIPTDLGSIKSNTNEIVSFLGEFYKVVKGKTLTLLTSFAIIKILYTSLNHDLKKEGINLYAQGLAGSKVKLINSFLQQSSNSILLGTDSFWEGVDIPGDDLKYLVIHKFPFSVPTDPIFQARSIFFKDPFLEYSIPKAIIKLKQGFGRLIRNKEDKGVVILLDSRIYSTKWGELFLKSFPSDINIRKGTSKRFIDILKDTKK